MKEMYDKVMKRPEVMEVRLVMNNIIGRNKDVWVKEEKQAEDGVYVMKVLVHDTYVLANLPH